MLRYCGRGCAVLVRCEITHLPRTLTFCLCGNSAATAAAFVVVSGVGLGEHAGFPAGAICGPERQAGVPAREAEKGGHNFVEGLLLRIAQVRPCAHTECVCYVWWAGRGPPARF